MEIRKSPGFWALTLGAVGGAAGFFGPIILNPDANQGPMLGIFITGPGGALAGAVLGFLFRILPFSDAVRGQALTLAATLLGVGTLWFALPDPQVKARVIDGAIGTCRPAGDLLPASISRWENTVAQYSYATPRDNWRADTQRMVREHPGVVVELEVARSNAILEHRRPWDRGHLSAQGWKRIDDTESYFGGGDCDSYPLGKHVMLLPTSMDDGSDSKAWPPSDLPDFLGLQVLEAVPTNYLRLVSRS